MKKVYEQAKKIIITGLIAMLIWPIAQYMLEDRDLSDAEGELKSKVESLQIAEVVAAKAQEDEAIKKEEVCKQRIKVAAIKLNKEEYKADEGRLKQILSDCFYDFQ
jgi:hypothetical protein